MEEMLMDYRHPVEGSISLKAEGDRVSFKCRWPIDRYEDDWITMTDSYERGSYVNEIQRLLSGGKAVVVGRHGKLIFEASPGEQTTRMQIVLEAGPRPQSLYMTVDVPPNQLLPNST